jgi:hypothetical protein
MAPFSAYKLLDTAAPPDVALVLRAAEVNDHDRPLLISALPVTLLPCFSRIGIF